MCTHNSTRVSVCVCRSVPWESKSSSHLLLSGVGRGICPRGAARPFFTWLQHITSFPQVQTPTPPRGLTVLTPTSNPQKLSAIHLHPFLELFILLLFPPSILSGSAADGWPLRKRLQEGLGRLSGTFQSCSRDEERWIETKLAQMLWEEGDEDKKK